MTPLRAAKLTFLGVVASLSLVSAGYSVQISGGPVGELVCKQASCTDVTVQLTTDQLSLFYYQFSGDSVFAGLKWQQVPTMVFTKTTPLVLRNVSQGHQLLQVKAVNLNKQESSVASFEWDQTYILRYTNYQLYWPNDNTPYVPGLLRRMSTLTPTNAAGPPVSVWDYPVPPPASPATLVEQSGVLLS
ncbi:hypothetical protein KFL_004800030 [Klebsormidium nitens]|uniref:Uncharacterized protein n=1 Tax=Klebsormidium nitens TaxID=105231 RepID=A0A1Y1ILN1_KLENI|nr:hypothetical protein KFL_004800030 [Klebsormidium nitens]|eukprot:GAQ89018.1 hypothetical protein KFL_004800030 [Klebsormidium nitens]